MVGSEFLAEASRLLFASLDIEATLDQVIRLLVPTFADGCEIIIEHDGVAERLAFYHSDPDVMKRSDDLLKRWPPLAGASPVIRHGRSMLFTQITEDLMRMYSVSPEHLDFVRSMKIRSGLSVPLTARDRLYGAMRLVVTRPERAVFTDKDVAFAEELARPVSIAIDNARLFASERRARERLRAIVDNSPAAIHIRNRDLELTFINQEGARILGETSAHPPIIGEAVMANTREVFETKQPLHREEVVERADGPHTYVTVKFPLFDERGEVKEVCGISTDITERKRLEAQLWQAQKMEALGRLAGGVAHDFSNLCVTMSRLIEAGDVAGMRECLDRATAMTKQLLMFARRQPIEQTAVDVHSVVTHSEALLARIVGEHIVLEISSTPAAGHIRADATQLEQALINLVINARDAMPEGGRVRITSEPFDADGVPHVRISVRDQGAGMSDATRAHLFEPFFTTKPPGRGSGLGLSIVYGVVERAGGRIEVETKLGEGSAFHLLLKRVEPSVHRATRAPGTANETILLVEDDDDVREFVEHALSADGYHVLAAADGHIALRLAERHPGDIHLLLSDVMMPELNGSEVAARILPLRPTIKILHISGYTGDALRRQGTVASRASFLEKPFTAESLSKKVRAVLDD